MEDPETTRGVAIVESVIDEGLFELPLLFVATAAAASAVDFKKASQVSDKFSVLENLSSGMYWKVFKRTGKGELRCKNSKIGNNNNKKRRGERFEPNSRLIPSISS